MIKMGKSIRHKWVKMVILYTAFVMALKKDTLTHF